MDNDDQLLFDQCLSRHISCRDKIAAALVQYRQAVRGTAVGTAAADEPYWQAFDTLMKTLERLLTGHVPMLITDNRNIASLLYVRHASFLFHGTSQTTTQFNFGRLVWRIRLNGKIVLMAVIIPNFGTIHVNDADA